MECREATLGDLPDIIRLLTDDELGLTREQYELPVPQYYVDAFHEITNQAGNSIIVAAQDENVIGCLQLTFIPGLTFQGMLRAQIEGVRVDSSYRNRGIGELLIRHVIYLAKERGCRVVQLTTNKLRTDAQRFYTRLGFKSTHVGMKIEI
ncbi:putative acetyltransferase [compost metagenome]